MEESLKCALLGLEEALDRLDSSLRARDGDHIFIAIGEALAWLTSADQFFENTHGSTYTKRRKSDLGGVATRGARWARNQNVHQLVAVHEASNSFSFPLTFPLTFFTATWKFPSNLPPPGQRQPDNERAYTKLAGQGVLGTLRQSLAFLSAEATL
jgi:hypothetical protein